MSTLLQIFTCAFDNCHHHHCCRPHHHHHFRNINFVYDIDHIYVLWIENSSESNPDSYDATKQLHRKHRKNPVEAFSIATALVAS